MKDSCRRMDRISGGKEKSERGTSASDDPRPWPTYSQKKHSAHPSGCMAASMRVSKNRPRFRISDTAIRIRISYVKNVRRTASILRVNSVFANITINSDSATCRSVFPRMPQPPPLPERRSERCGRCAAGRPSGAAGCLSAGLRTGSYDEKSLFSQKIGPKFAGGGILLILHRP